jgi:hypothetical protein
MAGMSLRIEGRILSVGQKTYHCSCNDIFDLCLRPIRPGCSLHYIAPRKVIMTRLLKMASTNHGGDGSVVARPVEYFPMNKSTYLRSLLFRLSEFLTICVLHSEKTRSFSLHAAAAVSFEMGRVHCSVPFTLVEEIPNDEQRHFAIKLR